MKKLFALLLALVMVASVFVGCGNANNPSDNDGEKVQGETTNPTDNPNDNVGGDDNINDDGNNDDGNNDDGNNNDGSNDDGNNDDGNNNDGNNDDGNNDDGNNDDGNNDDGNNDDNTPSLEGKAIITLVGATFVDGKTTATYDVNTLVSVVAPDKDGETFIAWKDSEGNVLERLNDYDFVATENVTLTAEYVKNTSEGELYIDTDDGKTYYIAGVGSWKGNTLVLPTTYNGKPITKIMESAFFGNTDIVNLIIPDAFTEIPSKAFANCPNLKNVTLPKNYTEISYDAFTGSTFITTLYYNTMHQIEADGDEVYGYVPEIKSIRKLVVGEGVKYVITQYINLKLKHVELPDSAAFVQIDSKTLESINIPKNIIDLTLNSDVLSELTLPDGIERIDLECKNLETVNLPESLKFVGLSCPLLKEITIPSNVENDTINLGGCTGLEKVIIHANATSIYLRSLTSLKIAILPDSATSFDFYGCTNLEFVKFPNNRNSYIGRKVFDGCTSLTEINLPAGIGIDENAFVGSGIKTINYAGTMTEWQALDFDATSYGITVKYKANTDYDFDTGLRYMSFGDGTCCVDLIPTVSLDEYTIPKLSPSGDKVISMTKGMFADKEEYFKVTILADIDTIPAYIFTDTNITSISILGNTSKISSEAFYNCVCLESITLSNNLKTIGNWAFYKTAITSIVIPDSVTTIGEHAFYQSKLETLKLGKNLTKIGAYAFSDCVSLKGSIVIPNGITVIEEGTFSDCSIEEVSFGDNLTKIGARAFADCKLTNVVIPNSVTSIGSHAFYNCPLVSITLPFIGESRTASAEPNVHFAYIFSYTEKYYSNGVQRYYDVPDTLETVIISSDITEIKDKAFLSVYFDNECSIFIPNSVTKIGNSAFALINFSINPNITIVFNGTTEEWKKIEKGDHWLSNIDGGITVKCTDGDTIESPRLYS